MYSYNPEGADTLTVGAASLEAAEDETSRTTAIKVGLDDAERGSDRRERPQRADEPKTAEVVLTTRRGRDGTVGAASLAAAEDEGDEGVATRRRRGTKDEGRRTKDEEALCARLGAFCGVGARASA